jgi:microcystin-dependent protein
VYISLIETNPETLFGGVWERISGRFLFAADEAHKAETVGGAETHTLSIDEMPSHTHSNFWITSSAGTKDTAYGSDFGTTYQESTATGGGQPFSIMPPYLSVYMWKRTA